MKQFSNNTTAFFALLRAGLWEQNVRLSPFENIDFNEVYRFAEEQSSVGFVTNGLEHVVDVRVPKEVVLQFIGQTLQIEQHNSSMNNFIKELFCDLRKADIYTLLVKGQGVAQCYEKPLWRASGDIDLYMSEENFQKAKKFFRPKVESFDPDDDYTRHINMHYGQWVVEIHANQHCSLSSRINKVLDEIHSDLFIGGNVRSWDNGGTSVFLPSPDNDVILSFTHFLGHFYKGGIGVRQICDWCRLLWTYRESLNQGLLETRIKKAGLMSEWRTFAAFAVDWLGMPESDMPFYSPDRRWSRKALRILNFVIETGNFGNNRDNSYYGKYPFAIRKLMSFGRRCKDLIHHTSIFPLDSILFFFGLTISGIRFVAHGE